MKRKFRWLDSLQFLPGILILAASISISLFDFGKPGLLPVSQEQRPSWLDMPGNRQEAVDKRAAGMCDSSPGVGYIAFCFHG